MHQSEFRRRAEQADPEDVKRAAEQGDEAERMARNARALRGLVDDVVTFVNLIRDYVARRYTDVPRGTISAITVAVLYLVWPADLVPDAIPVVGWVDDAAVLRLCVGLVQTDVDRYRRWRRSTGEG